MDVAVDRGVRSLSAVSQSQRGRVGDGTGLMWRLLPAVALLLLAACGPKSAPDGANQVAPVNGSSSKKPRLVQEQIAIQRPLPPAGNALRFVGVWAATAANCASKPWRFTIDELSATDGPHCHIYDVSKVPGGYDLAVQCPAKKPDPTDLIKLRFAESGGAMLVESNAISPTGLIYCGQ